MTGIVYKSTGSWYTVKADNNQIFDCRIKGKFRMKGIKSTNPIAVGDVVDFEIDETSDAITGSIHHIRRPKKLYRSKISQSF
jgi:ribosome biogenesis GTPase